MKSTHNCKFRDIVFNPMMKRWECIECQKTFTNKERKVIKNSLLDSIGMIFQ